MKRNIAFINSNGFQTNDNGNSGNEYFVQNINQVMTMIPISLFIMHCCFGEPDHCQTDDSGLPFQHLIKSN